MTSSVRCERPRLVAPSSLIILGGGGNMPGDKCSNCSMCSSECTYVNAAKVFTLFLPKIFLILSSRNVVLTKGNVAYSLLIIKPSNRHPRYVERLENRLEKLEGLLNKVDSHSSSSSLPHPPAVLSRPTGSQSPRGLRTRRRVYQPPAHQQRRPLHHSGCQQSQFHLTRSQRRRSPRRQRG